jgi:hypothetical protein
VNTCGKSLGGDGGEDHVVCHGRFIELAKKANSDEDSGARNLDSRHWIGTPPVTVLPNQRHVRHSSPQTLADLDPESIRRNLIKYILII